MYTLEKRTGVCEVCGITYVNSHKPAKGFCKDHIRVLQSRQMMGENNAAKKWARRDPEGFRREQSRKTTISNEKSPRKGGWTGGGMNKRPSDYTEYQGAFMTASMKEHFELHMNEEQNGL